MNKLLSILFALNTFLVFASEHRSKPSEISLIKPEKRSSISDDMQVEILPIDSSIDEISTIKSPILKMKKIEQELTGEELAKHNSKLEELRERFKDLKKKEPLQYDPAERPVIRDRSRTEYLSQDFEGNPIADGWTFDFDDSDCFWGTGGNWSLGDGSDYGPEVPAEGNSCAYFDDYNYCAGTVSTMTSPVFSLQGAVAPSLKFYYWDNSGDDVVGVEVSTDGENFTNVETTPEVVAEWTEFNIQMTDYIGERNMYVRFVGTSVYGLTNPHIDDIRVAEPPTDPVAVLSTTSLDFGNVYLSSSSTLEFVLENQGGAELTGTFASTNDKFVVGDFGGTVAVGSSQTVTVTYTSTELVADTGYVIFTNNSASSPDSILVTGQGSLDLLVEGFESDWPPAGWTDETEASYGWDLGPYGGPHTGSQWAYCNLAGSELMTPSIAMPSEGEFLLKFWYRSESSSAFNAQDFDVVIGADTVFQQVDVASTSYLEGVVSLSAYSGMDIQVKFIGQTGNGGFAYGMCLDDVSIEPAPTEPILSIYPDEMTFPATVVGSSRSVVLNVSNNGSGDLSGTVTYPQGYTGPASFTSDDSELTVSYSPSSGGLHEGVISFTSNGGDFDLPVSGNAGGTVATWDDDFDGDGVEDWPFGWSTIDADGNGLDWDFYGGASHTGDGHARSKYDGSVPNQDFLVSPLLEVASGDHLTFYVKNYSSSYPESFVTHLSSSGGDQVDDFDVVLQGVTSLEGDEWQLFSFDLSEYEGEGQVRVAIECVSDNQFYLMLDDVATPSAYVSSEPIIFDYPQALNFGASSVGESDTMVFDYFNIGGVDLEITDVSFGNSGVFSLSSSTTLPVTTVPGGLGSFEVVFTPSGGSVFSESMTVTHNAGESLGIPLSGEGINALYIEDFSNGSSGWSFSDDGYVCPTDEACTNGNGKYWVLSNLATWEESPFLFHGYDSQIADADTAFMPELVLEAIDGAHYEIEFDEYNYWGSYAELSGLAISTDGGSNYSLLFESNYDENYWTHKTYDLTEYDGETVIFAFVYQGTNGNDWGVDNITIKSVLNPTDPIIEMSKPIFGATALGDTSSAVLYYANIGVGTLEATMTYPGSMSGPLSVSGLTAGENDSLEVLYHPTVSGHDPGVIIMDGTESGAGVVSVLPEANAGKIAHDFEERWCNWTKYNLMGFPYNETSDAWIWLGGDNAGHSGNNFGGVYSYIPYWGGVDDYLVSPKLSVEDGDIFSFWAMGGYPDGQFRDSMNVYISQEEPIMGSELDDGIMVDTGFVNASAFTQLYSGLPSFDKWDAHSYTLSASDRSWIIIHSEMNEQTGWILKIDDLAYPSVFVNPNPVLSARKDFDFGGASPSGASDSLLVGNAGQAPLVIDSMALASGSFFSIDDNELTFPITLQQNEAIRFEVQFEPDSWGRVVDTLIYFSNYTIGDVDAYGNGTDRTVLMGGETDNYPPTVFDLMAPDDGFQVVLDGDGGNLNDVLAFIWQQSSDPESSPIEYTLSAISDEYTNDTLTTQNSVFFTYEDIASDQIEDGVHVVTYLWNVSASDGWLSTEGNGGPRSLVVNISMLGLDEIGLPDVFALHDNYPNPFNPITNINYDIPEASNVSLAVYNIMGQKVRTLAQGAHEPGRYRIVWDATNDLGEGLSSGMYVYRIQAGDFVSVKKLILMK